MPENWVQRPVVNTEEGSNPGAPLAWGSPENPDDAVAGYGYVPCDTSEVEETFYYHSDHLGSTSYITDQQANVTQYDAYLPYGELLVDEHSSSADLPYKFNGKELDEETGLYYYGARYMNPVTSMWYGVDPLAEKYVLSGSYVYCLGNPVKLFDPDGKKGVLVHGTFADHTTWKNPDGIRTAIKNLFNDDGFFDAPFEWDGGDNKESRTVAAKNLISYIKDQINNGLLKDDEPITLIGHSHGGNVIIEAVNMMMEDPEFLLNRKINILTINTPVRPDYQLSPTARAVVTHVNVYDALDPVQEGGGNDIPMSPLEAGLAFRKFSSAKFNIPVDNPQGLNIGRNTIRFIWSLFDSSCKRPFHNSHNRPEDWVYKTRNINIVVTPSGCSYEFYKDNKENVRYK